MRKHISALYKLSDSIGWLDMMISFVSFITLNEGCGILFLALLFQHSFDVQFVPNSTQTDRFSSNEADTQSWSESSQSLSFRLLFPSVLPSFSPLTCEIRTTRWLQKAPISTSSSDPTW
jgi:hypothetical protein